MNISSGSRTDNQYFFFPILFSGFVYSLSIICIILLVLAVVSVVLVVVVVSTKVLPSLGGLRMGLYELLVGNVVSIRSSRDRNSDGNEPVY